MEHPGAEGLMKAESERAIKIVLDMANRYDEDIEGCTGNELGQYSEAISCCYRLAYIIKYGKFPQTIYPWGEEFVKMAKQLYKEPLTWPI